MTRGVARRLLLVTATLAVVAVTSIASWAQFPTGRPFGLPDPTKTRRPTTMVPPDSDGPVQPTFRTTVEFVEVAVVPTDRNGQFVGDLTREDFQLFEQGRRQRIAAFTRVDPPPPIATAGNGDAPIASEATTSIERIESNALRDDARLYVLVRRGSRGPTICSRDHRPRGAASSPAIAPRRSRSCITTIETQHGRRLA